jgi:hypothetical protein
LDVVAFKGGISYIENKTNPILETIREEILISSVQPMPTDSIATQWDAFAEAGPGTSS